MNRIKLSEFFPTEHHELILRYKDTLPKVLKDYDVAIFMARKAICFYKALVLGGFVEKPVSCEILTNRALTYNIFEKIKNKKVVVIDDVKIKGASINKTLKTLSEKGIKADVYLMTQAINEEPILNGVNVIESFSLLSESNTKQLSKHIADFIAASICPYNIDQPIYSFDSLDSEAINDFVKQFNLIDISSGLQKKYGIKNYILEIPRNSFSDEILGKYVTLCKIRFLHGEYRGKSTFLATPFILFDEMNYSELSEAFLKFENDKVSNFIHNENEKIIYENKLKILSYAISAQLMNSFLETHEIMGVRRLDSNDNFVFFEDVLSMITPSPSSFSFDMPLHNLDTKYNYTFTSNQYLQLTYDFLYSENMKQSEYCDSEEKPSLDLLILSNLENYITNSASGEFDSLIFSSIVDVLIDIGVLIPTIVHHCRNDTIVRAYKSGEVYALNEEHFKLFTYMLSKYLESLKHDSLGRIEFEKLCVIFFGIAIEKKILGFSDVSDLDDTYSICYSKFGPRVSMSGRKYEAGESTTLASKLLRKTYIETDTMKIEKGTPSSSDDISDDLVETFEEYESHSKYKVEPLGTEGIREPSWLGDAERFAKSFSRIYRNLFDKETGELVFDEVRNMHVYSYSELLTLMAIGLNKKEQLLSLLAEVHLFNERGLTGGIERILIKHQEIFDGLVSGMWKYACYAQQFKEETNRFKPQHPVKKLTEELGKKDDEILDVIKDEIEEVLDLNRNVDLNFNIDELLKEAGRLIYSAAYAIWFMSKKYGVYQSINNRRLNLELHRKREFYFEGFSKDKEIEFLRKSIEDQVKSNTVEQNITYLEGLKSDARKILQNYHDKIAEGSKQKDMTQTIIHGDYVAGDKISGDKIARDKHTTNIFNFQNEQHRLSLDSELEKLMKQLNERDEESAIDNARQALKDKDESKVISVLKGMGSVAKNVLSKIASEMIVAYLKQNGVL